MPDRLEECDRLIIHTVTGDRAYAAGGEAARVAASQLRRDAAEHGARGEVVIVRLEDPPFGGDEQD